METAALWKALEKQHKTQSLENGSGGSLVSHSSHRPGGYGHTKNQEIRVGSVLCWRHSKAPSAWAPAIALTGTSAGLCRTRFSQKRRLFRPGGSLTQNGHLVHHEMPASLCSDKVAFLLRNTHSSQIQVDLASPGKQVWRSAAGRETGRHDDVSRRQEPRSEVGYPRSQAGFL